MLVNSPAMSAEMPSRPTMLDAALAKSPPGWANMGQADWPNVIASAGLLERDPGVVE